MQFAEIENGIRFANEQIDVASNHVGTSKIFVLSVCHGGKILSANGILVSGFDQRISNANFKICETIATAIATICNPHFVNDDFLPQIDAEPRIGLSARVSAFVGVNVFGPIIAIDCFTRWPFSQIERRYGRSLNRTKDYI